MPFPLLALIAVGIKCACGAAVVGGVCYCAKKAHDAYKEGQRTKRQKLGISKYLLEAKRKENEELTKRNKELDDKLKEGEDREKEIEKEISEIKKEIEDPNTTKKKREELESKLVVLVSQLDELRKNNKRYRDEISKNNKTKEDNSKTINNTVSNSDDKHWIWNFLTLENIVIMGACYALYKILKDDK